MSGTGGIKVGRARVVIDPSWSGFASKLRHFLRSEDRQQFNKQSSQGQQLGREHTRLEEHTTTDKG